MNVQYTNLEYRKKKLLCLSIIILWAMIFLPMTLKAQSESEETGWTLIQVIDGVEFYHETGECDGQPVLFLKIKNTNAIRVTGSWRLLIDANEHDIIFSDFIMPINAGTETTGTCNSLDPSLVIPTDLSVLQINKLQITASIEQ